MEDVFALKHNNFGKHVPAIFQSLHKDEEYADMTLISWDKKHMKVNKFEKKMTFAINQRCASSILLLFVVLVFVPQILYQLYYDNVTSIIIIDNTTLTTYGNSIVSFDTYTIS